MWSSFRIILSVRLSLSLLVSEPTDIMQSVGSSNKTALFNLHTGVVTSGTSESFLRYRENKNNNPFRDIFTRASSSDIQLNSIISKNSAAAKNRTQSMSGDDVQGDEQVITSSLPASFQQQKHEKRWRTQSSSSTASSDVASNMVYGQIDMLWLIILWSLF